MAGAKRYAIDERDAVKNTALTGKVDTGTEVHRCDYSSFDNATFRLNRRVTESTRFMAGTVGIEN
jgi:hypothetical protein